MITSSTQRNTNGTINGHFHYDNQICYSHWVGQYTCTTTPKCDHKTKVRPKNMWLISNNGAFSVYQYKHVHRNHINHCESFNNCKTLVVFFAYFFNTITCTCIFFWPSFKLRNKRKYIKLWIQKKINLHVNLLYQMSWMLLICYGKFSTCKYKWFSVIKDLIDFHFFFNKDRPWKTAAKISLTCYEGDYQFGPWCRPWNRPASTSLELSHGSVDSPVTDNTNFVRFSTVYHLYNFLKLFIFGWDVWGIVWIWLDLFVGHQSPGNRCL